MTMLRLYRGVCLAFSPRQISLYFTELQHAKFCSETRLRPGYILNVFLNCRKFQPQYSYQEYSCERKLSIMVNHAHRPFRQLEPKGKGKNMGIVTAIT